MKKTSVDSALIRHLAELLKETELSEIEIQQENFRVRVARQVHVGAMVAAPMAAALASPTNAPEDVAISAAHPGAVASPMVGNLYTAARPGAEAFIKVGDSITVGQTLFIVEAMKVMNPILAPRAGTITKIFIENAQPIEFGEPLMVIE
jgi:acetyl-CoA carboxylase biotin carboxyl carrier protein